MPMHHLDLNALESFSFLFKTLWSLDATKRAKVNIVDTILFKDGLPFMWLFTSDKTGEIMKKKADRLDNITDIIRVIKSRSRALKGLKDMRVRNKIATIWYLESGQRISSYLVDEVELASILHNHLTEILCIQVFMGAYYLKGNGVFEHRLWTERDGTAKHITYEQVDPIGSNPYSVFTNNLEKLVVTERQHAVITAICKYLCKQTRMMTGAKVSNLIFQVVFSSSWVPYIVSCRKVSLEEASDMFIYKREAMIYAAGEMPVLPNFNPNSLMLPMSWTDFSPQKLLTAEQKRKIYDEEQHLHNMRESQRQGVQHRKQAVVMQQGLDVEPVGDSSYETAESDGGIAAPSPQQHFPPPLSTRVSNLTMDAALMDEAVEDVKVSNEAVKTAAANVAATMGYSAAPSNTNSRDSRPSIQQPRTQRPSHLSMRNNSTISHGSGKHSIRKESALSLGVAKSVGKVHVRRENGETVEYVVPNPDTSKGPSLIDLQKDITFSEVVDTVPFGEAVGRIAVRRRAKNETAELEKQKEQERRRKQQIMMYRPESAHTIATLRMLGGKAGQSVEGRMNSAFALIKDLEENGDMDRLEYMDDGGGDVEDPSYSSAQPISKLNTPQLAVNHSVAFTNNEVHQAPARHYEEPTESSEQRVNSFVHQLYEPYIESDANPNTKSDGCHNSFIPKELLPPREDEPLPFSKPPVKGFAFQKNMAGTAKHCFGTYCNFGRRAKHAAQGASMLPPKVAMAATDCPHQLTYKSILLAKAEADFLKKDLDDGIESLVDQIQLSNVTADQVYTYFVRRHLNRVAEKCQEEARSISFGMGQQSFGLVQDLNVVYRRLVYSDALGKVHPSRFYYTVPVCSMCYQIYIYLDDQRELIVLHNLDQHQRMMTAAANAQIAFNARQQTLRTDSRRPGKNPIAFKQKHWMQQKTQSAKLRNSSSQPIQATKVSRPSSEQTCRFQDHSHAVSRTQEPGQGTGAGRRPQSAGAVSRRTPSFTEQIRTVVANGNSNEYEVSSFPPESAINSPSESQQKIPRSVHDDAVMDRTSDSGIGSRGPIRPISEHHRKNGKVTISSWVRMLSQKGSRPSSAADAAHGKVNAAAEETGMGELFDWDTQAKPTYLHSTRGASARFQNIPSKDKKNNVSATSSKFDAHPSGVEEVSVQRSVSRPRSANSTIRSKQIVGGTSDGNRDQKQVKTRVRPKSADAVPKSRASRSTAITSLEKTSRPAKSITDAQRKEAEVAHMISAFNSHMAHTVGSSNDVDADGAASAYAYSSLPFMAAPMFPASEDVAAEMVYQPPPYDYMNNQRSRLGSGNGKVKPITSPIQIRNTASRQPILSQQTLSSGVAPDLSALLEGSKEESQYSLNAASSPCGTTSIPPTVAEVKDDNSVDKEVSAAPIEGSLKKIVSEAALTVPHKSGDDSHPSQQLDDQNSGGAPQTTAKDFVLEDENESLIPVSDTTLHMPDRDPLVRQDESISSTMAAGNAAAQNSHGELVMQKDESVSSMMPMNMSTVLSTGSIPVMSPPHHGNITNTTANFNTVINTEPNTSAAPEEYQQDGAPTPNSLSPMIAGANSLTPIPSETLLLPPPEGMIPATPPAQKLDATVCDQVLLVNPAESPSSMAPMEPLSMSPLPVMMSP